MCQAQELCHCFSTVKIFLIYSKAGTKLVSVISFLNINKNLLITSNKVGEINFIELYNMTGQKVKTFDISSFNYINSGQSISIPISYISEGIYFLHLLDEDSGKAIVKRIIVNH